MYFLTKALAVLAVFVCGFATAIWAITNQWLSTYDPLSPVFMFDWWLYPIVVCIIAVMAVIFWLVSRQLAKKPKEADLPTGGAVEL